METLTEDKQTTSLLKLSIAREQNKVKKDESKEQYIVRLESLNSSLYRFLHLQLIMFEAMWNPNETYSYEELDQYYDAAKFLKDNFKRDEKLIAVVYERMMAMNIMKTV